MQEHNVLQLQTVIMVSRIFTFFADFEEKAGMQWREFDFPMLMTWSQMKVDIYILLKTNITPLLFLCRIKIQIHRNRGVMARSHCTFPFPVPCSVDEQLYSCSFWSGSPVAKTACLKFASPTKQWSNQSFNATHFVVQGLQKIFLATQSKPSTVPFPSAHPAQKLSPRIGQNSAFKYETTFQ